MLLNIQSFEDVDLKVRILEFGCAIRRLFVTNHLDLQEENQPHQGQKIESNC